ncbi:MAG: hypothetical protein ACLFVU_11615 [Phycisphaerae bacterium]
MNATRRQNGFALIMVLMLLAMATIVGISYAMSTSVRLAGMKNLAGATRAQYLAESGIQHGVCLLETKPDLVSNCASTPVGPFHVDQTGDTYEIYVIPQAESDLFTVVGKGNSDGISQYRWVTVRKAPGESIEYEHGLVVGATSFVPFSVRISGDVHSNSSLINLGHVEGDVSAVASVYDPYRRINGEAASEGDPVEIPQMFAQDFHDYGDKSQYTAVRKTTDYFVGSDPLTEGGAVTAENPAGVVVLEPASSGVVQLTGEVDFEGTLVVHGDLMLRSSSINLRSGSGFPSIVCTGTIWVYGSSQAYIDGMVYVENGVKPYGDTSSSRTEIRGCLVSRGTGYDRHLLGYHQLVFDSNKSQIENVGFTGVTTASGVAILRYGSKVTR